MQAVVHLIGAAALTALAIYLVVSEPQLRRRYYPFRAIQFPVLVGAAVLVPLNVVEAFGDPVTSWRDYTVDVLTYAVLLCAVLGAVTLRIRTPRATQPKRILAIGAHPDDLELACGGTLARLADAGHEIRALVMSAGEVGGDSSIRPSEAQAAGRYLGLVATEVLDFPDTRLESVSNAMVAAIERNLKDFSPDVIFTHSAHDQHQDHHAVHAATLRAARRHPAILCYESPSVTAEFNPRVFVDITEYVPAKAAAVARHRDQRTKPYMTEERVSGMAAFRGHQAKINHAEAFEPVRLRMFEGAL